MAWLDRRRNRFILAGAVLLVLTAAALLLLSIPEWGPLHHQEEGLLRVCWTGGEATYVDDGAEVSNGSCSRPEELRWPPEQIPLSVTTISPEGQVLGSDHEGARTVVRAFSDINTQLGFGLFAPGPANADQADVVVRWGAAYDISGDGADVVPGYCVHRRRSPAALRADVYVRAISPPPLGYRIAVHELLHSGGLRHDDHRDSIMYPLSPEMLMGPLQPARITDHDRALLRGLYHHR